MTLIELLVSMAIMGLAMSMILFIQVLAQHHANHEKRKSDNFRRVVGMLDKVEELVRGAQVYSVSDSIIFLPLSAGGVPLLHRLPQQEPSCSTLAVVKSQLVLRNALTNTSEVLFDLQPWESLTFVYSPGEITVAAAGTPPVTVEMEGIPNAYILKRSIYLDFQETLIPGQDQPQVQSLSAIGAPLSSSPSPMP